MHGDYGWSQKPSSQNPRSIMGMIKQHVVFTASPVSSRFLPKPHQWTSILQENLKDDQSTHHYFSHPWHHNSERLCSADLHSPGSPHPTPASCWYWCCLLFCSSISTDPKPSLLHGTNIKIWSGDLDNPGAEMNCVGEGCLQAERFALEVSHTHTNICSLKNSGLQRCDFLTLFKHTHTITNPLLLISSSEFKSNQGFFNGLFYLDTERRFPW